MRSAPTLKIWMTPLASVAMLEKLALLKIAACRALAGSKAASGWTLVALLAVTVAPVRMAGSRTFLGIADLSTIRTDLASRGLRREQHPDSVLPLRHGRLLTCARC
jgi:hypothetical protein